MKNILIISILAWLILLGMNSCNKGMYDNIEKFGEEKVYPAKFDTISGKIGFERVEIDLMKAGRIPSNQIYLGKASKTIVEYDKERITIDSVVSWINIPNLKLSKLYRFRVYTQDEFGNKSVPQEIALIPYTKSELTTIAVQSPRIFASPTTAVLDWANNISSILLTYCDLSFSYVDQTGQKHEGTRAENPRIFAGNLKTGDEINVDVDYRVVPKVNGIEILDTVILKQEVSFYMPSASTTFLPAEADILRKNGVITFNAAGVANIKKLTFPIHTQSLQDLFYFSNLDEIDLTGGTLFEMTTVNYNNNGITASIGGGPFLPYVRRSGNMADANAQFLVDLLENKMVKKVKYIPHSLGIDHLIQPYIESGLVTLVNTENEPELPLSSLITGQLQATNWKIDLVKNPSSYPAGNNLKNVIQVIPRDRAASFIFKIPLEYQFNSDLYPYLNFKVFAPDKSHFPGVYDNFRAIWPRFMNRLWAFPSESPYGQELWQPGKTDNKLTDSQLGKWVDMKIDLSLMKNKHNRVIVINIGGEPAITGGYKPAKDIVYYFANFRLSKN